MVQLFGLNEQYKQTCCSSLSWDDDVPESEINGDTTLTLCTDADGASFVPDVPALSPADAMILTLPTMKPTSTAAGK